MEKANFIGNIERATLIGKFEEVQKCTSTEPVYLGTRDGVHLFKVSAVMAVDTAFPTKKGGVTTALLVCPLEGGKSLKWADGECRLDAGPLWIYKASRMFRVLDATGDPVKKGRQSTAKEVAELKKQLDTILQLLAQK